METKVNVGISARHIHLTREDLDKLFGEGYELTVKKMLSQPGQFASEERVTVVSPAGGVIERVSILGPLRNATQLEISRSDAIKGKFDAPVRSSGDTKGSGAFKIINPLNGNEIEVSEGVIVADRHIHFSLEQGEAYGVKDKDVVSVKVSGAKGGIMFNVLCRVKDNFALDCHIDTDDANAFGLKQGDIVEIVR